MPELAIHDTPETFEERRQSALHAMSSACSQYDEDSRFSSVRRAMKNGRVPDFLDDSEHAEPEGYDNHKWKIATSALYKALLLEPEEIEETIQETREKDNPVSATDGSKGQWEHGRRVKLETLNWLLHGEQEVGEITGGRY